MNTPRTSYQSMPGEFMPMNTNSYFDDYHPDDVQSLPQRMSAVNIDDGGRGPSPKRATRRPTLSNTKSGSMSGPSSQSYIYFTLARQGSNWETADRAENLDTPQSEIAKKVRKGSKGGDVAKQLGKMAKARKRLIEKLEYDVNATSHDGSRWEIAYVDTVKATRTRNNKTGEIVVDVKVMDVILQRIDSNPTVKRNKSVSSKENSRPADPSRRKSMVGDFVDDRFRGGRVEERRPSDTNPGFRDDVFSSKPLFSPSGRPMDEHGEIRFDNAGFPKHIPKERPIGGEQVMSPQSVLPEYEDFFPEIPKEMKSFNDGRAKLGREQSFPAGRVSPDVVIVGDDPHGDPPTLDQMYGSSDPAAPNRGRKQHKNSHGGMDHMDSTQPQSTSRRRPSQSQSRARSKSQSQQTYDLHRRQHVREYMGESFSESENSETSVTWGDAENEDRSSHTTQDTIDDMAKRGSLNYGSSKSRPGALKQHHRGPSYPVTPRYPNDNGAIVNVGQSPLTRRQTQPSISRSMTLPEYAHPGTSAPIVYQQPLSARADLPPAALYPDEVALQQQQQLHPEYDTHSRHADDYMRHKVLAADLRERERQLHERTRDLELREEQARRREMNRRRESYHDDRAFGSFRTGLGEPGFPSDPMSARFRSDRGLSNGDGRYDRRAYGGGPGASMGGVGGDMRDLGYYGRYA